MRYIEIVSEKIIGPTSQPYPFRLTGTGTQTHENFDGGGRLPHPIVTTMYGFSSQNGLDYTVKCHLCRHTLDVEFSVPSDTKSGRTAMTGAGDAVRVLATVFAAVQTYLGEHDPRTITFCAKTSDRGRVALYDRFVSDKNVSSYFPGFELTSRRPGMSVKYTLSRPVRPEELEQDRQEAAEEARRRAEAVRQAKAFLAQQKADSERRRAEDEAFMKSGFSRGPRPSLDDILDSDDELLRDLGI